MDQGQDRERLLDIWLGLTGQAPLPEGPLIMPVLSGSMRPVMPLGSRLVIRPCDAGRCRRGDVAVHVRGQRLVAHRILLFLGPRRGGWAFLKGDANDHGEWCRCAMIKGVVATVLPPDGDAITGQDPFSPDEAASSGRRYLRHLLLAWPRAIRNALRGSDRRNGDLS